MMNTNVAVMRTDNIGFAHVEQIGSHRVTNIGGMHVHKVGASYSVAVQQGLTYSVAGSILTGVGQRSVEHVQITKTILAGKTIGLGAGEQIILQIGQKTVTITLDTNGITLDGNSITLTANSKIELKAGGASLTVGGGQVQSNPMPISGGNS